MLASLVIAATAFNGPSALRTTRATTSTVQMSRFEGKIWDIDAKMEILKCAQRERRLSTTRGDTSRGARHRGPNARLPLAAMLTRPMRPPPHCCPPLPLPPPQRVGPGGEARLQQLVRSRPRPPRPPAPPSRAAPRASRQIPGASPDPPRPIPHPSSPRSNPFERDDQGNCCDPNGKFPGEGAYGDPKRPDTNFATMTKDRESMKAINADPRMLIKGKPGNWKFKWDEGLGMIPADQQ